MTKDARFFSKTAPCRCFSQGQARLIVDKINFTKAILQPALEKLITVRYFGAQLKHADCVESLCQCTWNQKKHANTLWKKVCIDGFPNEKQ